MAQGSSTMDSVPVHGLSVERLIDAPMVSAASHPSIGDNIQGPSLVRMPGWVGSPLGRYYLYFADHKGRYIRLAYADQLTGPWTVHVPGVLRLEDTPFPSEPVEVTATRVRAMEESMRTDPLRRLAHSAAFELSTSHIASPDVHVDLERRRFVMYYHGLAVGGGQVSRVAVSRDGLDFEAHPQVLGRAYMRAFRYRGMTYVLAMPGQFYRSEDPLGGFSEGPMLFNPAMRHSAVLRRGDLLYVFWTQVGHAPERILLSTIDLRPDWMDWHESEPVEILRPERPWEGADAPIEPSVRGVVHGTVNQLRDPAVYVEDNEVYLLYAVAGESGIAIARVPL